MGTASRPNDARFSSNWPALPRLPPLPAWSANPAPSGCDRSGLAPRADSSRCIARIDPKIGRRLRTRIGGHQDIVGRLLLAQARLSRQRAIHVSGECRRVRDLEYVRVHDAGNARQCVRDLRSPRKCGVLIRPRNSHIDGRRLAEIEDLVDNVRRLKKNCGCTNRAGGSRRSMAMSFAVGACFSFSEYLAVHGTHGSRVGERNIDAAVQQTDVVEQHVDLIIASSVRICASTCAKYCCVFSSQRVPGGASGNQQTGKIMERNLVPIKGTAARTLKSTARMPTPSVVLGFHPRSSPGSFL